jgi:hypothetical protein
MNRVWLSTAGLAGLLCVLGIGTLFLPWAATLTVHFDPSKPLEPGESIKPTTPMFTESYPGYELWHAGAAAGGFLGLLLLLIATGGLRPAPLWRSAILLAVGGAILVAVVLGMNVWHAVEDEQLDMVAGRLIKVYWGAANYIAMGLAAAIMLVAAIELRGRVAEGRREARQAEPDAAPDPSRDIGSGSS